MRAFLRFCADGGWSVENPAAKVKAPKVDQKPTMPFTADEMKRIVAACDVYPDNYGNVGGENAVRLRALVLLMRSSGMRIGDCVTLSRDRLNGSNLLLYTQKTRCPFSLRKLFKLAGVPDGHALRTYKQRPNSLRRPRRSSRSRMTRACS